LTLVQTQPHPASTNPLHGTVVDVLDTAEPQVYDDMSVEAAFAVLTAARTSRLVVCDQDGQSTGLVTQAELSAVRDGSTYTDRVRLCDILGDHGVLTSAVSTAAAAEHATRARRIGVLSVADGHGSAAGILALSR
jgi:CBS-domain-containing membrane protein